MCTHTDGVQEAVLNPFYNISTNTINPGINASKKLEREEEKGSQRALPGRPAASQETGEMGPGALPCSNVFGVFVECGAFVGVR